jgi:NADPH:quinone reductase-like Zn-dependent oxidoreductase
MKAVVHDEFGPPEVLRIEDVERPVPKADEVLVRVHATTVNRSDTATRAGKPFIGRIAYGLLRPKWRILGCELAGEVAAVGATVSEFKVGDRVFGYNGWRFGAHAEFVCVPEKSTLAKMPDRATFEEAAAVTEGVIFAINGLRPANIQSGQTLLVYGASGSIGSAGVQLGRIFGGRVTAVCSAKAVEIMASLGADEVLDYTQDDFTKNGKQYDVIFDAVGKTTFGRCRGSLKEGGAFVATDLFQNIILHHWTRWIGAKRVLFPIPPQFRKEDVLLLKGWLESGSYRPIIDRRYPLEQVVEATRYVETHQKIGNVVLTI